jgi:hypothetical protein
MVKMLFSASTLPGKTMSARMWLLPSKWYAHQAPLVWGGKYCPNGRAHWQL